MIIQSKFGEFLESISSLLLAIQFKLENQCFSTGYVIIQNIETIAINKEKNNSNDLYLQKFLSSRLAPQAILPKLAHQ